MATTRRRRVRTRTQDSGQSLKVTPITSTAKRADISRQVDDVDSFGEIAAQAATIETPYDMPGLATVYEKSNMLRQCIAAIVTNVASFGWKIVPATGVDGEMDEGEIEELRSFIEYANVEESLTTLNSKVIEDYEKYGFAFIEVIRDRSGRIAFLRHAPSFKTRLLRKDSSSVGVKNTIYRGSRRAEVNEKRKFRRFVQIVNGRKTYFKEFGDPRDLHHETGEFGDVAEQHRATEIIHIKQNSEEPYGVPRWISQLPSILGSRESEEVNLRYFEENTVPPMIMTVAGGRLTQQSFQELTKLLSEQGVGRDRQNKILLIEAVPEKEGLDDKGTVSLQIEKLTDQRPSDGLFKDYDEANMAKVRSAFRLPPVIVGLSQDITFATANVSAFVAETQVFSAMRKAIDEIYNKKLVNNPSGLAMRTVRLESKAQAITNPEQVIKALTALNVMGAVTPRDAIEIANNSLQVPIKQYPAEDEEGFEPWMDQPINLTLKQTGVEFLRPQEDQASKDQDTKDIEKDGDIELKSPENGQQ